MAMYTALDGKGAANVVRSVPAYSERASEKMRALPMGTWYRLLARIRKDSQTRARLRLMLWTAWPHKQIMGLKPADIDWEGQRARVGARHKGQGHPSKWLPLLPAAIIALKEFKRVK